MYLPASFKPKPAVVCTATPCAFGASAALPIDFSANDKKTSTRPSPKLSLNINAFNGNKTNFGGRCNSNK